MITCDSVEQSMESNEHSREKHGIGAVLSFMLSAGKIGGRKLVEGPRRNKS